MTHEELWASVEGLARKQDAGRYREADPKIEELMENWLQELDRFKRVFRTEKGSTWFEMETGECFRVKRNHDPRIDAKHLLQPVTQMVVFTEANTDEIYKRGKRDEDDNVIGVRIPVAPYKEGVTPIEMGNVIKGRLMSTREENGVLACECQPLESPGDLIPSIVYHPGYPVTEIVK